MKKINLKDLSIEIRDLENNSSEGFSMIDKKSSATNDDEYGCNTLYCDTRDDVCETMTCITKAETGCIACSLTWRCDTDGCDENTRKCPDTASQAVYCCPVTLEGDQCIAYTKNCAETAVCMVTSDNDCNTSGIKCFLTADNCSETLVCPVTAINENCGSPAE